MRSRFDSRKRLFVTAAIVLGVVLGLALAEVAARLLEPGSDESLHVKHPTVGWIPGPGTIVEHKAEFKATYVINALGMREGPVVRTAAIARVRIAALGDSNTFGIGVAADEAWPNALEKLLFHGDLEAGAVYNLGARGYSVGQYLVRMRELYPVLRPHIVLVGFSMHNDLYDLVPPRMGGFVYGENAGRIYFDLDDQGRLVEHHDLVDKNPLTEAAASTRGTMLRVRQALSRNVALYRRWRGSHAAMWMAARFRPGGESLWPGIDTALKRELDSADRYRWQLAEAILAQLATEARATGAAVVLVTIPHHAVVSDEIWQSTYGTAANVYDRWIGGERLRDVAQRIGIAYVDTTERFVEEARRHKRALHFPLDRHYTAEGHRLIAAEVARTIEAKRLAAHAPEQEEDGYEHDESMAL